ncbi:DNA helicase [Agromyces sp. Marseille-Q5079]|uniref:DNA helicase n=1 Tax=Agromyces sp. Marseille-Q5079 TaxID=3439059 RepID=UPI003D9C8FE8
MSLSRKRQKELKRLRSSAEDLWGDQQLVIDRANEVAREVTRQLKALSQEEVVPRVRSGYQGYVRPRLSQAKELASTAGDSLERAAGSALGSVLSIGDIANDTRVRRALQRVAPAAAPAPAKKSGLGFGGSLAVVAGITIAAGIAYAVWQTFRADDELWVADDEPAPGAGSSPAL